MNQERYRLESNKYVNYIYNQVNTNGMKVSGDHMCACGFLIRNMKHPYMNEIYTDWYKHILKCGIQDQI